jgi:single stranded DNA-binding protein
MRQIILDGRLGGDAEVKTTSGGTQYLRFTLANSIYDKNAKDGKKTDWYDVTSFSKYSIDTLAQYLKKGTLVFVSGVPTSEVKVSNGKVYENLYISADRIELVSSGDKRDDKTDEPVVSTYTNTEKPKVQESKIEVSEPEGVVQDTADDGDDLPF